MAINYLCPQGKWKFSFIRHRQTLNKMCLIFWKIGAIRILHQVRDNEMKENENFDHNYQFVLLMMFLILSTQERDIREQF